MYITKEYQKRLIYKELPLEEVTTIVYLSSLITYHGKMEIEIANKFTQKQIEKDSEIIMRQESVGKKMKNWISNNTLLWLPT